jgi:diguanylate cyclase (GGDEF)-like protein
MIGILALFAGQAALALDNARLYTTERRRMRQIEFVNLIARSSTAASSIEQLLATIAELLSDTFEGCEAAILIRNAHGGFEPHGAPTDARRVQQSAHQGLIRDALDARSSVIGAGEDLVFSSAKSEMALPLVSMGDTLGVIVLSSTQPLAFTADDRSIAQATADVCATAIRNVQLSDELRRVTNTDPLTGIFNQRFLHFCVSQELARAKRFGSDFALVALDIRGFRKVNADHGFHRGDELLKRVAARLRGALRSVDTVCRYEADTFVAVLPEITAAQAGTVRDKLVTALQEAQQETVGAAPGAQSEIAGYPQDGESELHLLRSLVQRLRAQGQEGAKSGGAAAG